MKKEKDVSAGIATIRTLLKYLEHDKSETVQELDANLKKAVDVMRNTDFPVTAVASGSELFLRFITLAALDVKTFAECKKIMLHRGEFFLKKLMEARGKVGKLASTFIFDGAKILLHSKSRVVLCAMEEAVKQNKRFEVYVTKSAPDSSGLVASQWLFVERNEKAVLCSDRKFQIRQLYPLNQRDLPDEFKYPASMLKSDVSKLHPLVDYTPPAYITHLSPILEFLTPSARPRGPLRCVSEELEQQLSRNGKFELRAPLQS
ncbi:hypothetical protein LSTR_LSTR008683 [Laodelphax striatellus]|uniref:Translation initiation factor eIF2B subunit alpha n=1 Tax=Laodelphax striatellus TaxID=195883 RepID=A0A482WE25_LAOST|nr:hypothetical protein LSTR_LSTR008683 [Laodelphax striatellus]